MYEYHGSGLPEDEPDVDADPLPPVAVPPPASVEPEVVALPPADVPVWFWVPGLTTEPPLPTGHKEIELPYRFSSQEHQASKVAAAMRVIQMELNFL